MNTLELEIGTTMAQSATNTNAIWCLKAAITALQSKVRPRLSWDPQHVRCRLNLRNSGQDWQVDLGT